MAERIPQVGRETQMLSKYRFTKDELTKLKESMVILIDTREKKNDHIKSVFDKGNIKYESYKLDFGDYSFKIPANEELGIDRDLYFDHEIVVERKANLEELSQNFTKLRANLKKELAIAPQRKVMLIEGHSYTDLCHSFYDTNYPNKAFLASLHSFWHRFNCPFFFQKDNRDSAAFIYYFLESYLMEMCSKEYEPTNSI